MRLDDGADSPINDSIIGLEERGQHISRLAISNPYLANEAEGRELREEVVDIASNARMRMGPNESDV